MYLCNFKHSYLILNSAHISHHLMYIPLSKKNQFQPSIFPLVEVLYPMEVYIALGRARSLGSSRALLIPFGTYPYPIPASGSANTKEPPDPGIPNELGEPTGFFRLGFREPEGELHLPVIISFQGRGGGCHELMEGFFLQSKFFTSGCKNAVCLGNGACVPTPHPEGTSKFRA